MSDNLIFDKLEVGTELEIRDTKYSPWYYCKVVSIDGENVDLEDKHGMSIYSYKDEINSGYYFRLKDDK